MKPEDLAHILRAASAITGETDILVIGSQAIHASIPREAAPPAEAVMSQEADVAFFGEDGDRKADLVDGAIGEDSPFHEMFGYYAQGVSVTTATLPEGWRDRLEVLAMRSTAPGRGLCLERHDLVISKLIAGREKDRTFSAALVHAGLVDPRVLAQRLGDLPSHVHPDLVNNARTLIDSWSAERP